jgi:glycosyltransferase involved in cell wall biosynthesis
LIDAKADARRLAVWPRGVDTALFTPARRSQRLRDSWHVEARRPALLYVGRVSREKGLDILPAVQDALHALRIEHRFIIAGDGPMLRELRARMPDTLFAGVLSRTAVADVLASADLFVFPSRTDTAGNVVLEAQASGLPVVVSASGGPCENMLSDRSGVVCRSEAATEWAAAIAELLRDTSLRQTMSCTARDFAVSRRWDIALQPLYQAYREVASATTEAHPAPLVPASGRAT